MEYTIDWLKNNHQMIHYFGLGFIQLKINDDTRVHFYTHKLPSIMPVEEVHNHRYDFSSYIRKGVLGYSLFVPVDGDEYTMKSVSCDPDKPAPDDAKPCEMKCITSGYYTEGAHYHLNKDTFHRVYSPNEAITEVWRNRNRREFAQVIGHKDKEVCPFGKQVPEKELWEIVESML